ncbi:hypothetical protein [Streptomyces gardneri]|uniref:Uncharacterized protein n=1 Tax=Streptomyces gardneri TaxID=66892 RepID=A0A4Y3RZE8_9ACTN|nr:hypothetical protein [Streptomyces gardneri]GEB61290.1 hypothetical protein SGA01_68950 [Streptomyces gardneri]GHH22234.1 hypothetical protein GCM10017674_77840 [Streptomyces gardneri]
MSIGRPERHFHLPETIARPEGLSTDTARLLEAAVRQALADAVRAADGQISETPAPTAHGGARAETEETSGDGYRVPSYDNAGRPVTVRLRRAPRWGTAGPAGGLGIGPGAGARGRNLGGGARTTPELRSTHAAPAAPERPWTPERLAALRTRMGHEYHRALLGRLDADSLVIGSTGIRLLPAFGGTDRERTVAARLGAGAFYLEFIGHDRVGLAAVGELGGGYIVHRVTADGRLHETGLRVVTRGTDPVPAGILAYTGDLTTIREVTIVGRRPRNPRAVAAGIADVLHHLTGAPGVAAATLKGFLRDLDDDEVMACFEELRKLGRLGETLALVRVHAVRAYLKERHVPWSYIFGNWEPNRSDATAVFSGVLWGAGESFGAVVDLISTLGSADARDEIWKAAVAAVQHPLITGQEELRVLRDTFWERLERLEFFDAGRFLGQLVVAVMTLPEAVRALPKLAGSAVRAVAAFNRIGVAVLDRIGLTLRDVVRFLLTEHRVKVTDTGITLIMSGDDILVAGPKVNGTAALAHGEILQAIKDSTDLTPHFFSDAEVDAWLKQAEELLKEPSVKPRAAAGATAAGEAVLTVEALEDLVGAAIAELAEVPGSATLNNSARGTKLHQIFSRLVQEQFPHSGLHLVSETSLRAFARLPAEVLDLPIEEYVRRTPGLMAYERELRPLFKNPETGEVRLIGGLKPDLVVRAPGQLVVFDLTSVGVGKHLAKDILYTHLLHESGEIARVGETYWRHFGKTTAEIETLYPRAMRAARKRARLVQYLMAVHEAKKGTQ